MNPPQNVRTHSAGWSYDPVYAVGRLSSHFATVGAEHAFAQITAESYQGDQVDAELLQRVLSSPDTSYLGRYMCWRFACGGLDTFSVLAQTVVDATRLAEVLPPADANEVVNVIIGRTVPIPEEWVCAAGGLRPVQADRVLAFTLQEFAAAMPWSETLSNERSATTNNTRPAEFDELVRSVFLQLTRRPGNRGFTPEDMACNKVACEYVKFYHAVWQAHLDGKALVGIDAQHTHSADRRVVAVRATFRNRRTDVTERLQCLVDTSEASASLFFLISGLETIY